MSHLTAILPHFARAFAQGGRWRSAAAVAARRAALAAARAKFIAV